MCGRGSFFIHGCGVCTAGDTTNPPAAGCSAGCVILAVQNRKKLRVGDTITVLPKQPATDGEPGEILPEPIDEPFTEDEGYDMDMSNISIESFFF
jgi:hypothetical protein